MALYPPTEAAEFTYKWEGGRECCCEIRRTSVTSFHEEELHGYYLHNLQTARGR